MFLVRMMSSEQIRRSDSYVKRWHIIVAGSLLVTVTLVSWSALYHDPEPMFGGKPVSQWLTAGQEDASMALHEIGPPALPYILAKLAREDPDYGSCRQYRRLWNEIPTSIRCVLPKPATTLFDQTRAGMALLELGPTIIPTLARELRNRNPARRKVSAEVLGRWRERGKNIGAALPALRLASRDPDPGVAQVAEIALGISPAPAPHE